MRYLLDLFANQHGLSVAESTDSYSGYPQNLRYCLFGFDDIKKAEQLGNNLQRIINKEFEDVTVEVYHFRKRDGWYFWQRMNPAYEMYDVEDLFIDDDSAYPTLTFRKSEVDSFIEERNYIFDDEEYIEDNLNSVGVDEETYRENTAKMADVIRHLKDNEVMLYSQSNRDGYYEIVQIKTMEFREDSWEYAIGLLVF